MLDYELLKAPCKWCGYDGSGYWLSRTHLPTCPWYEVSGAMGRRDELPGLLHDAMRSYMREYHKESNHD